MEEIVLKNKVREYRVIKKITQEELAKMCGVTRQTIIAIEKGTFCPTAKLAILISIALDEKFENLFYLE